MHLPITMVPEHFTILNAIILIKQEKRYHQQFLEREQRHRKSVGLSVKSVTGANTQTSGFTSLLFYFAPSKYSERGSLYTKLSDT